jgi:hypothetical protein
MRLIKRVFLALKTFDRPATRRELEREAGLSKDDVRTGLKGLARRSLIVAEVMPRSGGTYRLVPGATMPEDLRGKFTRDAAFCERLRRVHLGYAAARLPNLHAHVAQAEHPQATFARYSVASPPAPSNAPGAARIVVKGVLDISGHVDAAVLPTCTLAECWKMR